MSYSAAIDCLKRYHENGYVARGRIGGYRPKKIAGVDREWLLQRCRDAEFTLLGLVRELIERGLKVDYRPVRAAIGSPPVSGRCGRANPRI